MFQKGARLPAAVAFMFASTNLVFELGIVLWIVFTLVGGALLWLSIRRGYPDPVCGMRVDYQTPHRTVWQ